MATMDELTAKYGLVDGSEVETNTDFDNIDYDSFTRKSPNPLKKLWIDKATLYEYENQINEHHQTTQYLAAYIKDEPCRISYKKEQATNIQSGASVVSQSITLFIRPDLVVRPGSVIAVNHYGSVELYKGSGKPAIYSNHQEIILELYEENA